MPILTPLLFVGPEVLFAGLPCCCVGGVYLLLFSLVIATFIFWIMMLIEACTKEPSDNNNDKLIWILILIFTHWIGALLYWFIRRPERIKKYGA